MKTEWDYTKLADAYIKRPDYSETVIDAMLAIAKTSTNSKVCDIGAGVAHLTLMLAKRNCLVDAVEPNDAMRVNGIERTREYTNVTWHEGTGEESNQAERTFELVTFGSSFNVCNRQKALTETAKILRPSGWFGCMWNHRDLSDPIQSEIEEIIRNRIPEYGYGTRREDQSLEIKRCGLFSNVMHLSSEIIHEQTVDECLVAWKSHATLERQAGSSFEQIIEDIDNFLSQIGENSIKIPYSTKLWMAQCR
jgi:ubiquinone/menaquinone biosynthesis C-methylase UbiE